MANLLSIKIKNSIDTCVLCWLATATEDGLPNVSPKEIFTYFDDETLLVADIASPNTVDNLLRNPHVCVSFVDVFLQKGYQLKGIATLVPPDDEAFGTLVPKLIKMTKGLYPIRHIIKIKVSSVKPIVAPSYYLFPNTSEESRKASAYKTYGLVQKK